VFKPEQRQIIIDLETLSTRPNACIVSIGAVAFTIKDGITEEFIINIDAASSKKFGLHLDPDTIDWWKKQSPEAIKSWQNNPVSLDKALHMFCDFYGPTSCPVWGNGSSFDITIMESALYAIGWDKRDGVVKGSHLPWKFWDIYDLRTITNLFGVKVTKTQVNHNALHDAIAEANTLLGILRS
jgi:DNA polymerase III epsilon subunit-like protein